MGLVNNEHRITKLEESGGGGAGLVTRIEVLEEDVEHLEDEYTGLVSYKQDEVIIGEWLDGRNIYRKVFYFDYTQSMPSHTWEVTPFSVLGGSNVLNAKLIGEDYSNEHINAKFDNNVVYLQTPFEGMMFYEGSYLILEYLKNEN